MFKNKRKNTILGMTRQELNFQVALGTIDWQGWLRLYGAYFQIEENRWLFPTVPSMTAGTWVNVYANVVKEIAQGRSREEQLNDRDIAERVLCQIYEAFLQVNMYDGKTIDPRHICWHHDTFNGWDND